MATSSSFGISNAIAKVDQLIAYGASFEQFGYDESVMNVINHNSRLDVMLHITPGDKQGKSNTGLAELYRDSIFDAIRDFLIAAWEKLCAWIRKLRDMIVGFWKQIQDIHRNRIIEDFQKRAVTDAFKKFVPPDNYAISASDLIGRAMAIIGGIKRLEPYSPKNSVKKFEDPSLGGSLVATVNKSTAQTGITFEGDGRVQVLALETHGGKNMEQLGWNNSAANQVQTIYGEFEKISKDLGDKVNELQAQALNQIQQLKNSGNPDQTKLQVAQTVVTNCNIYNSILNALDAQLANCHVVMSTLLFNLAIKQLNN